MRIDVFFGPGEIGPPEMSGRVVAVIDVLRASTTIAAAPHDAVGSTRSKRSAPRRKTPKSVSAVPAISRLSPALPTSTTAPGRVRAW